ncbi:MAG: hypothetical protein M1823_001159 [Watsoniomyces obsoletus]|nr:MAG: hypothetical protein M1823_001159 [Watsoniomyces obsoletus]
MWVQYWGYLPAIVEEAMNDGAPPNRTFTDISGNPVTAFNTDTPTQIDDAHPSFPGVYQGTTRPIRPDDHPGSSLTMLATQLPPSRSFAPGYQLQTPESALAYGMSGPVTQGFGSYGLTQTQLREAATSFGMGSLSASLPEYSSQSFGSFPQQRYPSMMHQFPPLQQQFAGQTALNYHGQSSWMPMPFNAPYTAAASYSPGGIMAPANPAAYGFPSQQPTPAGLSQSLLGAWPPQHQAVGYPFEQTPTGQIQRDAGASAVRHVGTVPRRSSHPMVDGRPQQLLLSRGSSGYSGHVDGVVGVGLPGTTDVPPSSITNPSVPRGPPRKPKQSGHALWVGNLPPSTNVVELKDYFSREATNDIESVFLISKSNCAFVNYKTEGACAAAMERFHDSRFKGVRLVCRLRRASKTGEAVDEAGEPVPVARPSEPSAAMVDEKEVSKPEEVHEEESRRRVEGVRNRYFIVKSLTVEDLESSVRNGIWATQKHNETVLNEAYAAGINVYLIFSANKSGEYYGYARMVSAIEDGAIPSMTWAPRPYRVEETSHPRAIPTPATDHAPRGQVIDDSARGTIFWEVDQGGDQDVVGEPHDQGQGQDQIEVETEPQHPTFSQASGRPFRVEWVSTARLPFYRTRGLRNPWNANREIKIARDGTELETAVGMRLLEMFHRAGHQQQQQHPQHQQQQTQHPQFHHHQMQQQPFHRPYWHHQHQHPQSQQHPQHLQQHPQNQPLPPMIIPQSISTHSHSQPRLSTSVPPFFRQMPVRTQA